jgi:hypothetical protein
LELINLLLESLTLELIRISYIGTY